MTNVENGLQPDLPAPGAAPAPTQLDAPASALPETRPQLALVWPIVMFAILTTVLAFVLQDLQFDLTHGISVAHVELELVALVLACVGAVGTTFQLLSALRRARELHRDLRSTREVAERWRTEKEALLRRFGMAVEHHFLEWGLTSAEKEVALLVLRGLSYKEVASSRGTAERTVRHQALGIYRKAGVAGRAEMAAVFLHDVLLAARPEPEGWRLGEARPASPTLPH